MSDSAKTSLAIANGEPPAPDKVVSASNAQQQANAASFKLMLLIGMVLQNTSTVLVGRYTRSGVPKDQLYDVNHLILIIEASKFMLAAGLEYHTTGGELLASLEKHVFSRPLDALKILVPALLYLVQNTLLYVALSNLTAPIFQVTYQGKLVTTAIVSVILLQRKYQLRQWACLCFISVGVAIVVLGAQEDKPDEQKKDVAEQSLVLGLSAVSVACLSSALAGVYFEKVLKKPATDGKSGAPASLWMRNIQMAFFSMIIAYLQGVFKAAKSDEAPKDYLHGFTAWAWILVALQAAGGLLVAAVIKYADNVLKGLATGVSVVVSSILSLMIFGTQLGGQFVIGAVMILTSVYFFSNPLPPMCQAKMKDMSENDTRSLLPK